MIISGAGLPASLPKYLAEAGMRWERPGKERRTMIAPIVSSAKSAIVICRMWDRKYHHSTGFRRSGRTARRSSWILQRTALGVDTRIMWNGDL